MDNSRIMDIFAYYFSEYDMDAFKALGFETQSGGFEKIASVFNKKASYLRRLRDEYDVVTNSHRKGQRNRTPRDRIVDTQKRLADLSFDEITDIAKAFIENASEDKYETGSNSDSTLDQNLSEEDLERIINFKDRDATIRIKASDTKVRVYNTSIIRQLKLLYGGQCQLCGKRPFDCIDVDICEVHHISYFLASMNNNSDNLIVLCPNHHRLIHKLNPTYDAGCGCFRFSGGKILKIQLDMHLLT